MNPSKILWLLVTPFFCNLVSCDRSGKINNSASGTRDENKIKQELLVNLSSPNGGPAYADLLHRGEDGFKVVADALAANEITPENYISFDYDLKTRWDDGPILVEKFESYMFSRAEKSDDYARKLAGFYKAFSLEELEEMKTDPRAGAKKVASLASQEREKPAPSQK